MVAKRLPMKKVGVGAEVLVKGVEGKLLGVKVGVQLVKDLVVKGLVA